jgi:hypothetical protein
MATASPPPAEGKTLWIPLALFVSVIGVVGSLYLSISLELKACPLCFYQRAFIMAAATVLFFGIWLRGIPQAALTPLALASTVAGTGIAGFHVYLDAKDILECPIGVTGFLLAPQESFVVYAFLLAFLLSDLFWESRFVPQGLGAVLIGIVLAILCLNPAVTPPAPNPTGPYPSDKKLDTCRKVYRPAT